MKYRDLKRLEVSIPKGYRRIRQGERVPENYLYLGFSNNKWIKDGGAVGSRSFNEDGSFRIKPK